MQSVSFRKFIIFGIILLFVALIGYYLYYSTNLYLAFNVPKTSTFMTTDTNNIYMTKDGITEPFEIRGVNMGAGVPGHFATDHAITEAQYLSWFKAIKAMGANTVRIYTIHNPAFYKALLKFNTENDDPLYLIQGVWLNDYNHFSHRDGFDPAIQGQLLKDVCTAVDVIWGRRNISLGSASGTGIYRSNVSQWVIGYILGVEWEEFTVIYTDHKYESTIDPYQGDYMYSTQEASPFETMLAEVGDRIIEYETNRYGVQRLVAFSNWPTTDPFDYDAAVSAFFTKVAKVDVEHIKTTDRYISGTFASYHVYPYYPDYLSYEPGLDNRRDLDGNINTDYAYLKTLTDHHNQPVVIAEYGIPSSRGMAQRDRNTGRNQGFMSEQEQADALIECYHDIMNTGCSGSIMFAWQDEWFKRTWNTMENVSLYDTAYWSDAQTNEQFFGILSFDPGKEKSICYVDGDSAEWQDIQPLTKSEDTSLSMLYDEKDIYFLVQKPGINSEDRIIIPIDTTQKTGSSYASGEDLHFNRDTDFIIKIQGDQSRVTVQERYNVMRATLGREVLGIDPYIITPEKDSSVFQPINMILQMTTGLAKHDANQLNPAEFDMFDYGLYEVYETGKLMEGNGNPDAEDFNSLTDFAYGEDCVEIRIPWQLLNFSNPNEMKIHDDYYDHYGVDTIKIDQMYAGMAVNPTSDNTIELTAFPLKGWGDQVTYHERLKAAYYAYQSLWAAKGGDSK